MIKFKSQGNQLQMHLDALVSDPATFNKVYALMLQIMAEVTDDEGSSGRIFEGPRVGPPPSHMGKLERRMGVGRKMVVVHE